MFLTQSRYGSPEDGKCSFLPRFHSSSSLVVWEQEATKDKIVQWNCFLMSSVQRIDTKLTVVLFCGSLPMGHIWIRGRKERQVAEYCTHNTGDLSFLCKKKQKQLMTSGHIQNNSPINLSKLKRYQILSYIKKKEQKNWSYWGLSRLFITVIVCHLRYFCRKLP